MLAINGSLINLVVPPSDYSAPTIYNLLTLKFGVPFMVGPILLPDLICVVFPF